jgi:hypothetical protein
MGWLFTKQSKPDLIRELVKPYDTETVSVRTIAHAECVEGYHVLWSVVEITAKAECVELGLAPGQSTRYIRCDLLDGQGGQWGYKPLEENVYPYYPKFGSSPYPASLGAGVGSAV